MKLLDWIIIIVMICILLFAGFYYFNTRIQECNSNPLVYGANLYEETYPVDAYGSLTLIPKEYGKKATTIYFNSNNFTIEKN